ncbi:hypothetical protein HMPREF1982_01196 [Clostridiales bacterium oral taxon 876 str. F0540]|nr:hypothetical protein HMPREF1982_01196 [Clostridiales bacterium oral taxon 876 str. F0540]
MIKLINGYCKITNTKTSDEYVLLRQNILIFDIMEYGEFTI